MAIETIIKVNDKDRKADWWYIYDFNDEGGTGAATEPAICIIHGKPNGEGTHKSIVLKKSDIDRMSKELATRTSLPRPSTAYGAEPVTTKAQCCGGGCCEVEAEAY